MISGARQFVLGNERADRDEFFKAMVGVMPMFRFAFMIELSGPMSVRQKQALAQWTRLLMPNPVVQQFVLTAEAQ